jgi:hypothetical protein
MYSYPLFMNYIHTCIHTYTQALDQKHGRSKFSLLLRFETFLKEEDPSFHEAFIYIYIYISLYEYININIHIHMYMYIFICIHVKNVEGRRSILL